ncbi:hypothetical protein FACS1894200_12450 [Spirochaetia bacterium]|nr:hypothetical protein FACS1894200_12450 [Spirochaetia bacterium]
MQSRSIEDVLTECRTLRARGIQELCLIGQDLGSYGMDIAVNSSIKEAAGFASMLPQLLRTLSMEEGQFWVRLLYIHPDHFPEEVLDICRSDPRILPYFDLPFQHGSSAILARMGRRRKAEEYLALIQRIRESLPAATIRSTFLVGFPGETEGDFEALLDFQDQARLDWLGCFTYSREENTPAYAFKNRVPKKLAAQRKRIIEERQQAISTAQMARFVATAQTVLIEERFEGDEEDKRLYLGRLACQAPEVDGAAIVLGLEAAQGAYLGKLLPCTVLRQNGFDLEVLVHP